jgi:hypothetical protein
MPSLRWPRMHNMAQHGFADDAARNAPRAHSRRSATATACRDGPSCPDRRPVRGHHRRSEATVSATALGADGHIALRCRYRCLKDGVPLGAITSARRQAATVPGSPGRPAADLRRPGVIAIENVGCSPSWTRATAELRVALEQQTATSELLKVIGRSTFDLQPVFRDAGRERYGCARPSGR